MWDLTSLFMSLVPLFLLSKKWCRVPIVSLGVFIALGRYMHYRHDYSWVLLGKICVNAVIPLVMAWMGNHLAAKVVESKSERRLWRVVFILVATIGIVGSVWVETQLDKEHANEVTTLNTKV